MFSFLKGNSDQTLEFSHILNEAGIEPVLMDIGSAGESPAIWKPLAACSMIVGFEPDQRNPDTSFGKAFQRALLVDKVVVPDDDADEVEFILTEYPSCSSMLEADLEALGSFVFRDLFKPVRRVKLPATSMNRVYTDHSLAGANWIKIDSQGADLRILKSIGADYLKKLLAVDIEPGFIDAYIGEDLYPECHAWLKDEGFWLSELKYQSYAKVRPETVEALEQQGIDRKQLLSRLVKAPTAAEARYLREVSWYEDQQSDNDIWLLGIAIGLANQQTGYVFDLLAAYEKKFGLDNQITEFQLLAKSQLEGLLG